MPRLTRWRSRRGCFGYPIEFVYSFEAIRAKYNDNGLTEYDLSYPWLNDGIRHNKALFSDDTQMT